MSYPSQEKGSEAEIRRLNARQLIPVILYSTMNVRFCGRQLALDKGAFACFSKGEDSDEYVQAIRQALDLPEKQETAKERQEIRKPRYYLLGRIERLTQELQEKDKQLEEVRNLLKSQDKLIKIFLHLLILLFNRLVKK